MKRTQTLILSHTSKNPMNRSILRWQFIIKKKKVTKSKFKKKNPESHLSIVYTLY